MTELSLNSHNDKQITPTTTTNKTKHPTAAAENDNVDSLPRLHDPVTAMSRITMRTVHQSKSSSSQARHGSNVDKLKYGVETNDIAALEHVSLAATICY